MQKAGYLLLLLTLPLGSLSAGEKEIATLQVTPEDVVQESIQKWKTSNHGYVVRWRYTEAGARRVLAFRDAHESETNQTVIGSFVWAGGPARRSLYYDAAEHARWKEGWLKSRTDKFFGISEDDANAIVAGLRAE